MRAAAEGRSSRTREKNMRSQRQLSRVGAALVVGAILALGTVALPHASAFASPGSIGTVSSRSGTGTVSDPYTYTVTVPDVDCIKIKNLGNSFVLISIDPGVEGAYYKIELVSNCTDGGGPHGRPDNSCRSSWRH